MGTLALVFLRAAEGLDDRREVRARIGEEIIDAVIGERAQERLGGDCWPLSGRCRRHALRPWVVRSDHLSPKSRRFIGAKSYPTEQGVTTDDTAILSWVGMAGRKARSAVFTPEVPAIHVFTADRS